MSANLMEGLNLHGANERNQCVSQRLGVIRQKADNEQQKYFAKQYYLSPMYLFIGFKSQVDLLRDGGADKERQNGDEIFKRFETAPY